jgi:hypothetical protein
VAGPDGGWSIPWPGQTGQHVARPAVYQPTVAEPARGWASLWPGQTFVGPTQFSKQFSKYFIFNLLQNLELNFFNFRNF